LEEEKERANELETSLQELQSRLSEDRDSWKQSETRYKEMLEQSQDYVKQLESATHALGKDNITDLKTKVKDK